LGLESYTASYCLVYCGRFQSLVGFKMDISMGRFISIHGLRVGHFLHHEGGEWKGTGCYFPRELWMEANPGYICSSGFSEGLLASLHC